MYKLLVGVLFLTSMSFGDLINSTVDGNTTIYNYEFIPSGLDSFDHSEAKTWGIDLDLEEDEVIKGATITMTDVYNWHPNEWNAFYIHLLDNPELGLESFADDNLGYAKDGTYDQWGYANYEHIEGPEDDYFVTTYEGDDIKIDRLNYNYAPELGLYGLVSDRASDDIVDNGKDFYAYKLWLDQYGNDQWDRVWIPEFDATITLNESELTTLSSYLENDVFGLGFDADCHYYGNVKLTLITEKTTSVPEPATLSLLGFGLLGLAFIRRKK